jgi:AcrR family transcriptional regulator
MSTNSGSDETKRRIIGAALTLFGEVGYTRATTRAIAEKAGVSELTLFRHFGTKKSVLLESIRVGHRAGFAMSFQEQLTGNYQADIRMMARLQRQDTARNFEILRLLLCDAQAVPELQEVLTAGAVDNRQQLADYFRQQIEAGVIRQEFDPVILATAFDSLFSSYVLFESFMGSIPIAEQASENVLEGLASLFVSGTLASDEPRDLRANA